jgi:hypothetical protein
LPLPIFHELCELVGTQKGTHNSVRAIGKWCIASVEEHTESFIATGQPLAYLYFGDEPQRQLSR